MISRQQLRGLLREHHITEIACDHERELDNPVCSCSLQHLGWHVNVGDAVDAWINHVLERAELLEDGE